MIAVVCLNAAVDRTLEAPHLEVGRVVATRLLHEQMSGKGVNLARILGALEVSVALYGFVGADRAAEYEASFAGGSVLFRMDVPIARTRINTTLIDPEAGTETHLREAGETAPAEALDALGARLQRDLRAGDWVVASGSLPPGLDAARFGRWLGDLRAAGFVTGVDTSGAALRAALAAGVQLCKPNRDELAEWADAPIPSAEALVDAARSMLGEAAERVVLVSDGPNGLYGLQGDALWQARITGEVAAVNTVGAGDAALAGYLWGLVREEPLEARLERAVRVATASLAIHGAGQIDPAAMEPAVEVLAWDPTQD